MRLNDFHNVYFIGVGGIGMSALARWFIHTGKKVSGYDRTSTELTDKLESEGIEVHFEDDPNLIPAGYLTAKASTLVVYTPAIPQDLRELSFLKSGGFTILKRSEVLGLITREMITVAVAGTHGKTTTSTMIAHILKHAGRQVTAFLGGISTNYATNLILMEGDATHRICVAEADEYDRSFLQLQPDYAVLTAMDADHLDIYGRKEELEKSFLDFLALVEDDSNLLLNAKLASAIAKFPNATTYGIDSGFARAMNVNVVDGKYQFDFENTQLRMGGLRLTQPGFHNVENAVAAIEICLKMNLTEEEIRAGVTTYAGVKRRFEYVIDSDRLVFVDDYAHHPVEISAFLTSIKALYPSRKVTAIFQPHLYSRTRDFAEGFAESLSIADQVLLLDIYPAREEPIPGVTSEMIGNLMPENQVTLARKEDLLSMLDKEQLDVLATIGAGDIDKLVNPIKNHLG